ncbi:thiamine-phosphate kinase [Paucibacter sp. JuS9]|uniref:thiamine-phosphate kinase n=1 Tax=Paucibacter sp. JuS9 TaxID=3228748 RepID=UPI0037577931
MSLGEFDLIKRFFQRARPQPGIDVGIGDDCAVWTPTPGRQVLVSSDMLVEGRHFLATVAPERLGHKALAVNLSDLAACGATPRGFTLALALPRADAAWLERFAAGLFALADAHDIPLIGGDTTAGPLNLCITVFGEAPRGQALLRSGATAGDDVYVSGQVGDARLALEVFRGALSLPGDEFERVRSAMEVPQPRVALGQALRGIASSAIDISDGLIGDLGHVLARSEVGCTLEVDALPRSSIMSVQRLAVQHLCTLSGGDDYELLFTAPVSARTAVESAARAADTPVARIGCIEERAGLRLVDAVGKAVPATFDSFDHFKTPHA